MFISDDFTSIDFTIALVSPQMDFKSDKSIADVLITFVIESMERVNFVMCCFSWPKVIGESLELGLLIVESGVFIGFSFVLFCIRFMLTFGVSVFVVSVFSFMASVKKQASQFGHVKQMEDGSTAMLHPDGNAIFTPSPSLSKPKQRRKNVFWHFTHDTFGPEADFMLHEFRSQM